MVASSQHILIVLVAKIFLCPDIRLLLFKTEYLTTVGYSNIRIFVHSPSQSISLEKQCLVSLSFWCRFSSGYRVRVPSDHTRRVPGQVMGSGYRVWVVQFIIICLYNSLMRRNINRQTATRRHVKLSNTKQKLYSQERFR